MNILRIVKIMLVAAVAMFAFLSGIFDLVNWGGTVDYVGMVTSMGTWQGGATS